MKDGKEYLYLEPTQTPINPPYSEACLLKKLDQLAKPDLGSSCPRELPKCEMQVEDCVQLPAVASDSSSAVLALQHDCTTKDPTTNV